MGKEDNLTYKRKEVELLTEIIDMDEDVTKLGHFLICKESKERLLWIDWSPYADMTMEDLKLYLELNCPTRISKNPLNKDDLAIIKRKRQLIAAINQPNPNLNLEL